MQHVWTVAWRPAFQCTKNGTALTSLLGLGQTAPSARPFPFAQFNKALCRARPSSSLSQSCQNSLHRPHRTFNRFYASRASQPPPQSPPRHNPRQAPQASSRLSPRLPTVPNEEVTSIFGPDGPPPELANTLLRLLQARRINGTLDLDFHPKLGRRLAPYPEAFEQGLQWLRTQHPVDEDAAILRRIEQEDKVIDKAVEAGDFKPQTGNYGAKLGEGGSIYGESQLDKMREERRLQAEEEEMRLDEYIQKQQKEHKEKVGTLQTTSDGRQVVVADSRPPSDVERWVLKYRLRATSDKTLEEAMKIGKFRRLFPAVCFAAAFAYLSYLFAINWTPPNRKDRVWPDIPLSEATIYSIILLNLGVFTMWYFPPAWRLLNKYFITTAGHTRAFQILGNTVSHQKPFHLLTNMAVIWILGLRLHEDIGRGYFLPVYFCAGVFGSLFSLTSFTLRGAYAAGSLGASGSVAGVLAAYCSVNPDDHLTLFFIPSEWQETFSCKASTFLYFFAFTETASVIATRFGILPATIDYVAHLGGLLVGTVSGIWIRKQREEDRLNPDRSKEQEAHGLRWYEKLLGR